MSCQPELLGGYALGRARGKHKLIAYRTDCYHAKASTIILSNGKKAAEWVSANLQMGFKVVIYREETPYRFGKHPKYRAGHWIKKAEVIPTPEVVK